MIAISRVLAASRRSAGVSRRSFAGKPSFQSSSACVEVRCMYLLRPLATMRATMPMSMGREVTASMCRPPRVLARPHDLPGPFLHIAPRRHQIKILRRQRVRRLLDEVAIYGPVHVKAEVSINSSYSDLNLQRRVCFTIINDFIISRYQSMGHVIPPFLTKKTALV